MYKCPNCGGEMEFLPESGIIKCEYCGSEFTPEESSQAFKKTRKNAEEHRQYLHDGGDRRYVLLVLRFPGISGEPDHGQRRHGPGCHHSL